MIFTLYVSTSDIKVAKKCTEISRPRQETQSTAQSILQSLHIFQVGQVLIFGTSSLTSKDGKQSRVYLV